MKDNFSVGGVEFEIGKYTPRNNEFEKGLKYRLFVVGIDRPYAVCCGSTKRELKEFAEKNYLLWL